MKEEEWKNLVYAIQEDQCILILGPELATETATSFKLSEEPLKNLKSKGLPDDAINKLEVIKNQEFTDDENFLGNLKSTIGDKQTVRYKSLILKHAETVVEKPCIEVLANELAKGLNDKRAIYDCNNLAQVAQQYRLRKNKLGLNRQVIDFYKARQNEPKHEIFSNLIEIPFYLIINTTPDHFLYDTYNNNDKECRFAFYDFKGEKESIKIGTRDNPLIYNLFGSISKQQSLVLSEFGFLDFLDAIISKTPGIPDNIRTELNKEDKCFLFLGFGFNQWYSRILMHVLHRNSSQIIRENFSFAFEQFEFKNYPDFDQISLFYRQGYQIQIYEKKLDSFVKELKEWHDKIVKEDIVIQPTAIAPKEAVDVPPVIFLCHANENKDYAKKLSTELKEKGLQPWLDKDDIYGGDKWDEVLEETIEKEIDYFVVLQSKTMNEKYESYFFKEIKIALERDKRFGKGIRFIIPAKIEECDILEILKELPKIHRIELSNIDRDIDELIKTIEDDQKNRQARAKEKRRKEK